MIVTRRDLENYRAICAEIDQIEAEIHQLCNEQLDFDSVQGSTLEFPYVLHNIPIQGTPSSTQVSLNQLSAKLVSKLDARIEQRMKIEHFFDTLNDAQLTAILRGKYIEGKSWRGIARQIGGGNTEDSVKQRVSRYFRQS